MERWRFSVVLWNTKIERESEGGGKEPRFRASPKLTSVFSSLIQELPALALLTAGRNCNRQRSGGHIRGVCVESLFLRSPGHAPYGATRHLIQTSDWPTPAEFNRIGVGMYTISRGKHHVVVEIFYSVGGSGEEPLEKSAHPPQDRQYGVLQPLSVYFDSPSVGERSPYQRIMSHNSSPHAMCCLTRCL